MKPGLLLRGRSGLGDAIYLRPVVRAALEKYDVLLETCWPQIYADLPVHFVKPRPKTRDPKANVARQNGRDWVQPHVRERLVHYRWSAMKERGILAEIERLAGVPLDAPFFDLPPLPVSPVLAERLAVVRPVTIRKEWPNPARNCEPSYIMAASQTLKEAGFYVVSVANAHPAEEPIVGPVGAHQRFEKGELGVLDLLALVRAASVVVGPVGWIVPACMATQTPLVLIAGGQGGVNGPQAILDPRVDSSCIHWLYPDNYCRCIDRSHKCPKTITFFEDRFAAALEEVTLQTAGLQ